MVWLPEKPHGTPPFRGPPTSSPGEVRALAAHHRLGGAQLDEDRALRQQALLRKVSVLRAFP